MAQGDLILASWLNDKYNVLSSTIPSHNIPTNITNVNTSVGELATANKINTFINTLLGLRSNEFLRWADNWSLNISSVNQEQLIKEPLELNVNTLVSELGAMNGNFSQQTTSISFSQSDKIQGFSQTAVFTQYSVFTAHYSNCSETSFDGHTCTQSFFGEGFNQTCSQSFFGEGFNNTCTQSFFGEGFNNTCTQAFRTTFTGNTCTQSFFGEGFNNTCTQAFFREGFNNTCTQAFFREGYNQSCSQSARTTFTNTCSQSRNTFSTFVYSCSNRFNVTFTGNSCTQFTNNFNGCVVGSCGTQVSSMFRHGNSQSFGNTRNNDGYSQSFSQRANSNTFSQSFSNTKNTDGFTQSFSNAYKNNGFNQSFSNTNKNNGFNQSFSNTNKNNGFNQSFGNTRNNDGFTQSFSNTRKNNGFNQSFSNTDKNNGFNQSFSNTDKNNGFNQSFGNTIVSISYMHGSSTYNVTFSQSGFAESGNHCSETDAVTCNKTTYTNGCNQTEIGCNFQSINFSVKVDGTISAPNTLTPPSCSKVIPCTEQSWTEDPDLQ